MNPAWHVTPDQAASYADGSLPELDAWSVEKHLEACTPCAAHVSAAVRAGAAAPTLAAVRAALLATATAPDAPAPRPRRLRRSARRAAVPAGDGDGPVPATWRPGAGEAAGPGTPAVAARDGDRPRRGGGAPPAAGTAEGRVAPTTGTAARDATAAPGTQSISPAAARDNDSAPAAPPRAVPAGPAAPAARAADRPAAPTTGTATRDTPAAPGTRPTGPAGARDGDGASADAARSGAAGPGTRPGAGAPGARRPGAGARRGAVAARRLPALRGRVAWAAGPALRGPWLISLLVMAVGVVCAARATGFGGVRPLLLLLAPILPSIGVGVSYGRHADPMHEIVASTPSGGLRLLLTRTAAVLGVSVPLLTLAGLLLPATAGGPGAAAWLLPGLALTLAALALGSYVGCRAATVAVSVGWLFAVGAPAAATPGGPPGRLPTAALADSLATVLSGPAAQGCWAAAAAGCAGLLVLRRTSFDRLERI